MKKIVLLSLLIMGLLNAKATISQKTFKQLQKADKLIQINEHTKAKAILNKIINSKTNKIGKSYAYQALANIFIEKNQYNQVIKYYEELLKLNALDKNDLDRVKFSLSQMHLSQENYLKSIKYTKELLNSKVIKKISLYENLAIAYYHSQKFKNSIPYIKNVINLKKTKKQKEQWHRMLYSAYIEIKNYNKAIYTLRYMIKTYSSKQEYWMQLISIYQNTKNYKKSLATLELAYKKNIVDKKKNILYFVNILLQNKLYNKAGLLVEQSIKKGILQNNKKNFDILISSFLNARNYKKVLPKLNNSKYANSEKYKLILGDIYFNKSDYKNTIKVLSKYKFSKKSKYNGQRYILLGLSFHELEDKKQTIKYFKKAALSKYEKKRAKAIASSLGYKI